MTEVSGDRPRRWMLPTLVSAGAVILILAGVVVWLVIAPPHNGGGSSATSTPSNTTTTTSPTPASMTSMTPPPSPAPSPSPHETMGPPPTQPPVGPSASDIENIEAAIVTGNTQALVSHFTNPVMVILAASDGIGPQTPDEAAVFLAQRLDHRTGWNFSPTEAQLASWRATFYEQYFPVGALVGFDNEGDKISFTFTGTQISTVFISGLGDL